MRETLVIVSHQCSNVMLRMVQQEDQDNLRNWKNANRFSFFYHEMITPEMQEEWFEAFLHRNNDFMFVVRVDNNDIGCMGVRLCEMNWDVYNVILGISDLGGKGYMRQAMGMMCSYALSLRPLPVTAKVLTSNPALGWYYRSGFKERGLQLDHVEIELDGATFTPCLIQETSGINWGD